MGVYVALSEVRMTGTNRCESMKVEEPRTWRCQLKRNHKNIFHVSFSGHRKWKDKGK